MNADRVPVTFTRCVSSLLPRRVRAARRGDPPSIDPSLIADTVFGTFWYWLPVRGEIGRRQEGDSDRNKELV